MADEEKKVEEPKVTQTVPKTMEIVTPVEGKLTVDQWKSFVNNLLDFSIPQYFYFLFAQLALGVELKIALMASLVSMYGPLRDYFKKRQNDTPYLRDK